MRHTVVISDIHLWDAVPGDGLWMRYRQRRYFPDADLRALVDGLCARVPDGSLELVFNGDVFDFDVPPVVDGELHFDAAPSTAAEVAARLDGILDEHPVFVDAVARVLASGHTVVFVSGNHDAQLAFPAVRAVLCQRLLAAYAALGPSPDIDVEAARARLVFRRWFHRSAAGVHVEHGNQYDRYCSVRYPMHPFAGDGEADAVQPTVGSLSVRHVVGRLGYFNPNVDSTFTLSMADYLRHFARYYLFSKHSLVATWALGGARVALRALWHRERRCDRRAARDIAAAEAETGADPAVLRAHAKLFVPGSVPHVARIYCLDRVALAATAVAAAGLALAAAPVAAALLSLGAIGATAAFTVAVPNPELDSVYSDVSRCAREIARLHGARAVVFGHTHHPGGSWEAGVFYGNCGSWSPQFRDAECEVPVDAARPVVWLQTGPDRELVGGLYRFRDGAFEPVDGSARVPAARWHAPAPAPVAPVHEERLSIVA